MTQLNKTNLNTEKKMNLAAMAFVLQELQDQYGAVTNLAEEFEVSRPTVYSAREVAEEILREEFDKPSRGT